MASTTGMMAPAFFVGRNELISWVNDLLGLRLTKVEQCASGAVYCQIMDAAHRTTEVQPAVAPSALCLLRALAPCPAAALSRP